MAPQETPQPKSTAPSFRSLVMLLLGGYFQSFLTASVLLLLGSVLLLNTLGVFEPIEERLMDLRFEVRKRIWDSKGHSDEILLVEVTDDCLEKYGKWPWKRAVFADLMQVLSHSGAKAVGFDLSFYDQDLLDPASDQRFANEIGKHGRVILASEITRTFVLTQNQGVFELPGPEESSLGKTHIVETLPLKAFQNQAHGTGFVNILVGDGFTRRVPLVKEAGSRSYSSLALATYQASQDTKNLKISRNSRIQIEGYEVPIWDRNTKLDWMAQLFKHAVDHPLFKSLAYLNYLGPSSAGAFSSESVSNILEGRVEPEAFKNKIIVVGFNAKSLDKKLTPFGVMAGMEVQATAIHNLIHKNFLERNSNLIVFLCLLGLSLVLTQINLQFKTLTALILTVLLCLLIPAASLHAFCRWSYLLDITPLVFQSLALFVVICFLLISRSLRRRFHHLELLNLNSKRLFTILDPDLLTQNISEIVKTYSGAKKSILLLKDSVTEQIEYACFGGIDDELMVELSSASFQEKLFAFVKEKPDLIHIQDRGHPLGSLLEGCTEQEILVLPLGLKEQTYGLIIALEDSFEAALAEQDKTFWLTLCQIIVAALENARLYKLATVDGLTGLFVRSFFDVQIQKEFLRATRYNGSVGYLMSDIDHFKNFNDTYGHDVGDRVLRVVSDQIKESIRNVDIAARYGGEELCVILPNTDKEGALVIAERVRQSIADLRIPYNGEELQITVSIGVSCIPENQPMDVKEFMKQADDALYLAKDRGRNQVQFYSKSELQ
jgi:diguanylate cyclase (GGDEF)-like protein